MTKLAPLLVFALCVACGPSATESGLAGFSVARIDVSAAGVSRGVGLNPADARLDAAVCHTLKDGVHGTLDGRHTLAVDEGAVVGASGGVVDDADGPGVAIPLVAPPYCRAPSISADLDVDDSAQRDDAIFDIKDGSERWIIEVAHLFSAAGDVNVPIAPVTTSLASGAPLVFGLPDGITAFDVDGSSIVSTNPGDVQEGVGTFHDDRFEAPLPIAAGTYEVDVTVTGRPAITRCDGPARCTLAPNTRAGLVWTGTVTVR